MLLLPAWDPQGVPHNMVCRPCGAHLVSEVLLQAFARPDTHHRHSRASEGSSSSLLDSMLTVQPHALDDHVPALCGPLQAGDPLQPIH